MNDYTLVIECRKGNVVAQRLLFERFSRKMMAVCLRYANSTEEAEDVLQDGFIKVFNNLTKYSGTGSLEGWVRRIMVNTSLDQIRKETKFQGDVGFDDVDYRIETNSFNLSSTLIRK